MTNDTTAIQAFLDCIRDGLIGEWSGTYLVTADTLILQPSSATAGANVNGPYLRGVPTLIVDGDDDGPILKIWGKDYVDSVVGPFYQHGVIDGICIKDPDTVVGTSRHGLSLRGIEHTSFGPIKGVGLGGATVNIPFMQVAQGFPGPDWSAVKECVFSSIKAYFCIGMALKNDNLSGFIMNKIMNLDAQTSVEGNDGCYYDGGVGTQVLTLSANCNGAAISIGEHDYHPSRMTVDTVEIDTADTGVLVTRAKTLRVNNVRMIYRFAGGATRPAIGLGFGATDGTTDSVFNIELVTTAGVTLANIGTTIIDFAANAACRNVLINFIIKDDAAIGLTPANFMSYCSAPHASSTIRVTVNGVTVYDNLTVPRFGMARTTAASQVAIPATGWGSETAKLTGWGGTFLDGTSMWSSANNAFLIPYTGTFRARFCGYVPIGAGAGQIPVGGDIKCALAINRSGALSYLADYYLTAVAVTNSVQYIELNAITQMIKGDLVYVMMYAVPNSGTAYLTGVASQTFNKITIEAINI